MISSGDILEKEVGEEEKNIRAAFSLTRKLYPCIMFVDEADGSLRTRQSDDKKYYRSMMGEFLRECHGATADKTRNHLCCWPPIGHTISILQCFVAQQITST
jgi:SpoVK/Ycf46/Vps4 family AAA+-type ATPase